MKKKWIITGMLAAVAVATFIWAPRVALVAAGAFIAGFLLRGIFVNARDDE